MQSHCGPEKVLQSWSPFEFVVFDGQHVSSNYFLKIHILGLTDFIVIRDTTQVDPHKDRNQEVCIGVDGSRRKVRGEKNLFFFTFFFPPFYRDFKRPTMTSSFRDVSRVRSSGQFTGRPHVWSDNKFNTRNSW